MAKGAMATIASYLSCCGDVAEFECHLRQCHEVQRIALDCACELHHQQQPDCAHCRAKASAMFRQLSRSCACCGLVIPANFLISTKAVQILMSVISPKPY